MSLAGEVVSTLQTRMGPIVIRYLQDGDAPAMLEFINSLSRERTFVLFQGEQLTLDQEKGWLRDRLIEIDAGAGVSLGAFSGERAVGSSAVIRKPLAEQHVAVLGVSVNLAFRRLGLGGALVDTVISEATERIEGLRIIELSVMGPNHLARQLYASRGFIEHGTLPGGIAYRGDFVDHVLMHRVVPR